VASQLGNTVAVCRKYYIHPIILDGYLDGSFPARFKSVAAHGRLSAHEASVVSFLRRYKPKSAASLERTFKQSIRHLRKGRRS
jgi:DNA topoisomerase IB